MILDDGQRLERLTQADAVCENAAAEPLELVDRADHAIALEPVQLRPDHRVADAGRGFDDRLLVGPFAHVGENGVERPQIDLVRRATGGKRMEQLWKGRVCRVGRPQRLPLIVEPLCKWSNFAFGFSKLNHREAIRGRKAKAVGRQCA